MPRSFPRKQESRPRSFPRKRESRPRISSFDFRIPVLGSFDFRISIFEFWSVGVRVGDGTGAQEPPRGRVPPHPALPRGATSPWPETIVYTYSITGADCQVKNLRRKISRMPGSVGSGRNPKKRLQHGGHKAHTESPSSVGAPLRGARGN